MRGRFGDTSGRPYVEGRLTLPRLSLAADISFCVDTGADCTVLLPVDGFRMGLDYTQLGNEVEDYGLGGVSLNYREDAILTFSEAGRFLYLYRVAVRICAPSPDIMILPSLLGRDVLNRWRMLYDPYLDLLSFKVKSADQTVTL